MSLSVKVGDAWKNPIKYSVNINNTWRGASNVFVNVDGIWENIYNSPIVEIPHSLTNIFAFKEDYAYYVDGNVIRRQNMTSYADSMFLDLSYPIIGRPKIDANGRVAIITKENNAYKLSVYLSDGTFDFKVDIDASETDTPYLACLNFNSGVFSISVINNNELQFYNHYGKTGYNHFIEAGSAVFCFAGNCFTVLSPSYKVYTGSIGLGLGTPVELYGSGLQSFCVGKLTNSSDLSYIVCGACDGKLTRYDYSLWNKIWEFDVVTYKSDWDYMTSVLRSWIYNDKIIALPCSPQVGEVHVYSFDTGDLLSTALTGIPLFETNPYSSNKVRDSQESCIYGNCVYALDTSYNAVNQGKTERLFKITL